MARERQGRKYEKIEPNMTPMIDVTFLLLIFFIVTLKFKILEGRLDAALPKDRGTNTSPAEEIEKIDIIMFVAEPGDLVPDPDTNGRLEHYSGRRVRIEIGARTFYFNPQTDTHLEDLQRFLSTFDKEETPVSIDARKGIIYQDVVRVLDAVIREEFEQVSFAGTFENE